MNFNKKALAFFIFFIYSFSFLPVISFGEDNDNLINSGDFESDGYADYWSGGVRDSMCAYEGEYGMQIVNPFGDINSPVFGHFLEYNGTITLEKDKFYTFSAYVMNPMASNDYTPSVTAYLGRGDRALFIDIGNVGENWVYVTASFMATEDTDCTPIISISGGDADIGFFIDCISITPETRVPKYTVIEGPDSLYIPDNDFVDYRYSIVTYDNTDTPINILLSDYNFGVDILPEGVEFNSEDGTVRVHSSALPEAVFTLSFSATAGITLENSEKKITVTKNLLSDSDFENGEENWISSDSINYTDGSISLYASNDGDYGKYTDITYTEQLFLMEGKMYVFKADVRSDDEYPPSSVYISNLSFASSGYAEINITGIGGGWSRVTSAFYIEDTGLYDLTINLYAPTERPIYVDNVYLGAEEEAPTSIAIHAPGNIAVPTEAINLPCYASVLDQMGNTMEDYDATLTIYPERDGVYLSDGEIVVESGAKCDIYTVKATFGNIESTLEISVSNDFIGDGSFEVKQANEWWTASDGSFFSIIDYNGEKAGHVYSPDSSCLVVNNSYMELIEDEYYVYNASAGVGEGIVTAFIADAVTGEYVPFAQYDPTEETIIPFTVDETVMGRLVLYIESDTTVGLIFDNISIVPAELSATEISVTGGEYGEFLRGSYNYVNNMSNEADSDISTTRWYISSSYDGHYEPIGIPNQNYLEFTEDMAGQYVVFEVTPICAYTGLVGESLRSLPVHLGTKDPDNNVSDTTLSDMTPIELENSTVHSFTDITSHWAENMISSLCASGIVSGKTKTKFYPEHYVTRAEFTAMVVRAFNLVSIPYSGRFEDVDESHWSAGYIEAAYRRGIVKGVSETLFAPEEYITREEMATIIYRAYLLAEGPMPYDLDLRYDDAYMIQSWSYDAVKTTTNLNIFKGKDMNLFKPGDNATRAEAASAVYRTLKCF
ncbi:MAG: S-layer homology domain-containing protein [Clostridia bacterium]